jgi:hypothetical protein
VRIDNQSAIISPPLSHCSFPTEICFNTPTSLKIASMDAYEKIEAYIADKYKASLTSRKSIGDFMISADHAVNVKSNNLGKQNYSPNIISIKKMHEWIYEQKKNLSLVFVDYEIEDGKLKISAETGLVPIEHISWDCLSIEAQGYGVIQMPKPRRINVKLTKKDFYVGFLKAYDRYRQKEHKKHTDFSMRFIKDLNAIDW